MLVVDPFAPFFDVSSGHWKPFRACCGSFQVVFCSLQVVLGRFFLVVGRFKSFQVVLHFSKYKKN